MAQERNDWQSDAGRTGSEDTSRAEEHVRNAEENRDALEAQARRTEATTGSETDQPVEGSRSMDTGGGTLTSGGMTAGAPGRTSEDTSEAEANVREAERNRDALEAQARRVERTTPDQ
jgi:cell division septum initiation protein DivIVA